MNTEMWFAVSVVTSFALGGLTQSFINNSRDKKAEKARAKIKQEQAFSQLIDYMSRRNNG